MLDKDAITVKLTGGLGNQLFIFAAGLASATRLEVPLVVDKSFYEVPGEKRTFQLDFLEDLYTLSSLSEKTPASLFSSINYRPRGKVFRERNAVVFDKDFLNVTPGTRLEGYFQSPRYFENIKELLLGRIVSAGKAGAITNSIALHLRRGDYLNPGTMQFHGVSSSSYALRAIDVISRSEGDKPVLVYSDDLDTVKKELNFSSNFQRMDKYSFITQDGLSDIQSLVQMSRSSHMVMSNSSFSWWAAYIISERNPESIIVSPRPWFADGSSAADLLLPHWLTLDARSKN